MTFEPYLVKNTTREQRERIVRDSLGCGGGDCENCSSCGAYGAGDPFDMYQAYPGPPPSVAFGHPIETQ